MTHQDSKRIVRRLSVAHTTRYRYDHPIERSSHRVHLRPIDDWKQTVLGYSIMLQPEVPTIEYEDVFGNWAARFDISQPYTELVIHAHSVVEVLDADPFAFTKVPIRPSFPLVWMPWERLMLGPYLHPVELAESQLTELFRYAMGFVERNGYDLMETLFAINLELFRDYKYVPGSTSMATTPFEVYVHRRGVCQDFANLFICMARLLGIPARYVCGYIYTGNSTQDATGTPGSIPAVKDSAGHRAQSDASHAWVQLYIPNVGWKGFDPTNGVLPSTDHVRVGYGRHYRDVTPTDGTLYSKANEVMEVEVVVKNL